MGVSSRGRATEWTDLDVYIPLPRAGGDAWVSIDRESGAVTFEDTDRGWVAYLNDLHKGRDAGKAWGLLIDASAILLTLVSLTGLLILWFIYKRRSSGLLLAAAGVVLCVLIYKVYVP